MDLKAQQQLLTVSHFHNSSEQYPLAIQPLQDWEKSKRRWRWMDRIRIDWLRIRQSMASKGIMVIR